MKKAIIFVLIVALILIAVPSVMFAAKPDGAGAEKVEWNLSGDVMPVPPYGSRDIIGSDTASKLIVNQPNGNTEVTITGAMNGLNPNTTYFVILSKGYILNTTFPGEFTSTVPRFTITTDEYGAGSWHINLRDEIFTGPGSYTLSVWINGSGKTILISDNFIVAVN